MDPALSKNHSLSSVNKQLIKHSKSLAPKADKPDKQEELKEPGIRKGISVKDKPKKPSARKEVKTSQVFYRLYKKPEGSGQTQQPNEENQDFEQGENAHPPASKVQNDEPFSRSVEVTEKTRLKNLKQLVLQDLNLQDMCAVRLFKEGIPLIGEMDLIKDFLLE